MNENNCITSFCRIKQGTINVNNTVVFNATEGVSSEVFLVEAYKQLQINYPKFYKMDNLCKLGCIASELLLKSTPIINNYNDDAIALIFSNSSSSLESDSVHQKSIAVATDFFPSPSVFVYTLPNIVIGEIAIKNSIKGENTFFIFEKFNASFMATYVEDILNKGKAQCCIVGWVDFYAGNYDAFVYSVEKKHGQLTIKHTKENINQLYK